MNVSRITTIMAVTALMATAPFMSLTSPATAVNATGTTNEQIQEINSKVMEGAADPLIISFGASQENPSIGGIDPNDPNFDVVSFGGMDTTFDSEGLETFGVNTIPGSETEEYQVQERRNVAPSLPSIDRYRGQILESLDIESPAINEAVKFLGVPYVWGGTSWRGVDCSGLTTMVYNVALGYRLPRVADAQAKATTPISWSEAKPGDLIFWGGAYKTHVAIYAGGNMMIHAPKPGDRVKYAKIYGSPVVHRVPGYRNIEKSKPITIVEEKQPKHSIHIINSEQVTNEKEETKVDKQKRDDGHSGEKRDSQSSVD